MGAGPAGCVGGAWGCGGARGGGSALRQRKHQCGHHAGLLRPQAHLGRLPRQHTPGAALTHPHKFCAPAERLPRQHSCKFFSFQDVLLMLHHCSVMTVVAQMRVRATKRLDEHAAHFHLPQSRGVCFLKGNAEVLWECGVGAGHWFGELRGAQHAAAGSPPEECFVGPLALLPHAPLVPLQPQPGGCRPCRHLFPRLPFHPHPHSPCPGCPARLNPIMYPFPIRGFG